MNWKNLNQEREFGRIRWLRGHTRSLLPGRSMEPQLPCGLGLRGGGAGVWWGAFDCNDIVHWNYPSFWDCAN